MYILLLHDTYIEEAKIGTTLGAIFGGILLGVILTTAAVAIIYRRSKKHVNERSAVSVKFILKLPLFLIHAYD